MNGNDPLGYLRSSVETQLSELNSRGRWYTTEAWQLPVAYIAATGFLIGQVSAQPALLRAVLIGVGCAGVILAWHLYMVHSGIQRAVSRIRAVEERLGLEATAMWKPSNSGSMIVLHLLYTAAAFATAYFMSTPAP